MKRSNRIWFSAVLIACISAGFAADAAQQYTFSNAGNFPGALYTVAIAIDRTHIAGFYCCTVQRGYVQTGKQFVSTAPTGAGVSYLSGINNLGVAVGGWCAVSCGILETSTGYTYNLGTSAITTFYYPGAPTGTAAYGINDSSDIVGGYCPGAGACPQGPLEATQHAFLLSKGKFTSYDFPDPLVTGTQFNAINKSGTIVGWYQTDQTQHGVMFQSGKWFLLDFPVGATSTFPMAINNSGVVAGYYQDINAGVHGFTYQNGRFSKVELPTSVGLTTALTGINDAGDLVGEYVPVVNRGMPYENFKGIPKASAPQSAQPRE